MKRYSVLGAGTTSDLCYSPAVHAAWCRGIERLVLMGRLGKGATETLQKLCVMRLRTCRSAHLSLPVLRLLVTCMYANAGRLNTQLQHYRRVSPTGDKPNLTVGFVETSSSSVNESAEPKSISLSNSEIPQDSTLSLRLYLYYLDMVDKFRAFFCISGPYLFRLIPYLLIRPHFTAYVTYSRPTKTVETTQSTRQDLATLPPSLLTDSEATAGMTQEFLSCLWERLRGGVAPVVHTSGEPSWLTSAWTSATEASVIAHLLPVTSTDIIQAIAGLLVHSGPQSKIGQLGWDRLVIDGHLEDPVLNKALGEFARLDHAQPDLAAQTLAQLFGRFLDRPGGRALIRQWVILSLPTLLSRQPRRLAIWATTVCLLAASTEPTLRAALCLCSTQVAFTRTSDYIAPVNSPREASQLGSASAIGFRQETSPLLSDLLCLAAVHFVRSGLLSRSDCSSSEDWEQLIEHRQAFWHMFEPLPGDELEFHSSSSDSDKRTLRRVYTLLQRELAGDN
ncbi:Huntingtin [Fasciolopsis buskii]|uniref:Huntingtin n=1 Tax=Fasciolopsis buskii TaxID=27845 RepID=A0A8E0S0T9_9TREM|nr:Huntingtin [Fasciolopsis buski]